MKLIKILKRYAAGLLSVSAASLLPLSCAFVGLGDATDLEAPSITVTSPQSMESVGADFTIYGTASDNSAVKSISVTFPASGQVYRYESGTWQCRASSDASWKAVSGGTWNGTEKSASWSVPVTLTAVAGTSEYKFSATAADAGGNSSSSSIDERTVVLDTTAPDVSVISPSLSAEKDTAEMASWTLRDAAVVSKLVNGTFTVSGTTKEDSDITSLAVSLQSQDGSSVFFTKTLTSETNLRNWSVPVTPDKLPEAIQSGKTIMRLYTEAKDSAGNCEKKTQGFLCWYPEADIPWAVIPFGYDTASEASAAGANTVYPGYTLQGQAYDDDGISSCTVSIYRDGESQPEKTSSAEPASSPAYYAWSVETPDGTSDIGLYYIVVTCKDTGGKASVSDRKYFIIQDVNAPIMTVNSPLSGASVIGDAEGNCSFDISLNDDGSRASLSVVRIDMSSPSAVTDEVAFLDAGYSGWTANQGTGNICSQTAVPYRLIDNAESSAKSGERYTWSYKKQLNIFSDFGIDGSSKLLSSQIFILRTSDGTSQRTASLSLIGDSEAPHLAVTSVRVIPSAGDTTTYTFTDGAIAKALPAFKSGDTVQLSGTWSDDSTTAWNSDVSKISSISFSWAGASIAAVAPRADGTWTTAAFTPPDSTTASISAAMTDWGGNTGTAAASFYIDTNEARLVRISSAAADGSYTAGAAIRISMEFNKPVTFSGGTTPALVLNNGRTASYADGNGTGRHYYTYTVSSGDDVNTLDVTSISVNGNTWKDSAGNTVSMTVPSGSSLKDLRTIKIDTTAPTLSSVTSLTSSGSYKAGNTVYISAGFSEDVTITGSPDMTITLNTGRTVSCTAVTGTRTALFTYTAADGDNAATLTVTALTLNGASVSDGAGNTFTGSSTAYTLSGIKIDTAVPATPVLLGAGGAPLSGGTKYTSPQTFTLKNLETGITHEYSLDGGTTWKTYTGGVSLSADGTYTITARQTDAAGNVSASPAAVNLVIDAGNLVRSVSAKQANGTYTTGDTVNIIMTLRRPVTITGEPELALKLDAYGSGSSASASYNDVSSTLTVKQFDYTVQEGDNAAELDVSSLGGTWTAKNSSGTDVTSLITIAGIPSGGTFTDNRSIKVVTGNPVIKNVSFTGTDSLSIEFDRDVSKGTGSITLVQSTDKYKAPAVLSAAKYTELLASIPSLGTYYTSGTNGSDSTGASDLSQKYILAYKHNTTDTDVTGLFTSETGIQAALTVTVPVSSDMVSVNGKTMTVSLTGGYALPVKGASYTYVIPSGAAVDAQSHANDDATAALASAGVEQAYIRIAKEYETITVSDTTATATQPLTAGYKIDCQTPGATVSYSYTPATSAKRTLSTYQLPEAAGGTMHVMEPDNDIPANGTKTSVKGTGKAVSETDLSSDSTITGTLGTGYEYPTGLTYIIAAVSSKTVSGTAYAASSYETAYRTTVQFQYGTANGYTGMWARGGDAVSGGVVTPGFPLSWDVTDYSGIRCMTYDNGTWYFVTWKMNTTGYIGFLAGNADADSAASKGVAGEGPSSYCWGSCAWTSSKEYFPVYAGRSMYLPTAGNFGATILNQERGGYAFQAKHSASR